MWKSGQDCDAGFGKILEQKGELVSDLRIRETYASSFGWTIRIDHELINSRWNGQTQQIGRCTKSQIAQIMLTKFFAQKKSKA